MCHDRLGSASEFSLYLQIDADLAAQTRASGCQHCGGRLHVSNYLRDPRGLLFEPTRKQRTRFSFCCDQDECRKRATPPSVRFFGRQLVLASLFILVTALRDGRRIRELCEMLDVDRRTIARWRAWWKEQFLASPVWGALRGLLPQPVAPADLPRGLLDYYGGLRPRPIRDLLVQLAPLTTTSDSSHDP